MSRYKRIKLMHQGYRDSFSREFYFPNTGSFPSALLQFIINTNSGDVLLVADELHAANSGLPDNEDRALKLMLLTIMQANMALNGYWNGAQPALPTAFKEGICKSLERVLNYHPDISYLANAVQLLFRIGEIDQAMTLIERFPDVVKCSCAVKKIVAMIHIMLHEYALALSHLKEVIKDPAEADKYLVLLMVVSCMHRMGGVPSKYIDFSPLKAANKKEIPHNITWLHLPLERHRQQPTVLLACNDRYFYEHALPMIYSINETNPDQLSVHLHLFNPNASMIKLLPQLIEKMPSLDISVTIETIESTGNDFNNKVIYACKRYIAADFLLNWFNSPLVVMDVDALVRKKWNTFFPQFKDYDVITRDSDNAPFWSEVAGGFVYLGGKETSKTYIRSVAHFLQHNLARKHYVWFLDQVALVASYDQHLAGSPLALKMPNVIDVTHGSESFSWVVVTEDKSGTASWQHYKEALCAKYGGLPLSKAEDAFELISKQMNKVSFVQIGAMDGQSYDPIYPFVNKFNWSGILVEPLPDMFERLKNNYKGQQGLIFENVGITNHDEIKTLHAIPLDVIIENDLPDWLKGMSTFVEGKLAEFNDYVIKTEVKCITLAALIEMHKPAKIDVLQIDTEGYDYEVFKQFDFKKYRPSIVNIEVINLSTENIEKVNDKLTEEDYLFYRNGQDIIAFENLFFAQMQSECFENAEPKINITR